MTAYERFMQSWSALGNQEREVMCILASRLLAGQVAYGKLYPGKLAGPKETLEEACDASIYTANAMYDLMVADTAPADE